MNTCGAKTAEIGGSLGDPWFLQWWKLLVPSAEQVPGNCGSSPCGWPCQPLLFCFVPSHLYTSQLCSSLSGVMEVGPSCSTPKGWGSWGGELFLAGSSLLALSNAVMGDGMLRAKWNFFLPFLIIYFQVFCCMGLLKFLKWALELSQSCFCL